MCSKETNARKCIFLTESISFSRNRCVFWLQEGGTHNTADLGLSSLCYLRQGELAALGHAGCRGGVIEAKELGKSLLL